jgi:hypothetical protein
VIFGLIFGVSALAGTAVWFLVGPDPSSDDGAPTSEERAAADAAGRAGSALAVHRSSDRAPHRGDGAAEDRWAA